MTSTGKDIGNQIHILPDTQQDSILLFYFATRLAVPDCSLQWHN